MINYLLGGLIIGATLYIVVKGILNIKEGKCTSCDLCDGNKKDELVQINIEQK